MEQNGKLPVDIADFVEQTSSKIATCKRSIEAPERALDVLRENVEALSTGSPTNSADRLSRKQRDIVHDLNIALMKDLQNIRSIATQLRQHCQYLTDLILKVSMDLPAFLKDISLQHLDENFSEVSTVQQLLNLNNIEGEMAPIHRRRLEREVGKIRDRMESGAGLSEIPSTLYRLQEAIMHLTTSCLAKLKEFVSVTTDSKEEPAGTTGFVYKTCKFLKTWWEGSSNNEDTFTTRLREVIECIEQEQRDLLPMSDVDEVTPNLTEFLLRNDLQTLSSFDESIAKIRHELLNINSSVDGRYKQAMAMADSL